MRLFDELAQALALTIQLRQARLRGSSRALEFAATLLEPSDFRYQRRWLVRSGSRTRPWLRRRGAPAPAALLAHRQAGAAPATVSVGRALLLLEPGNRLARLALTRVEPAALLFRAAPLDGEQLGLLG